MQNVTQEYKKSMKQPLRGRGYIMVTFGVINQEAQQSGSVDTSDTDNFTHYSNASSVFEDKKQLYEYATLEENISRVDGTQLFLPRDNRVFYDTGVVGNRLVSDTPTVIVIKTNTPAITFKGVTIDWGDNYATQFTITTNEGVTTSYANDKEEFLTEDTFENVTTLTIKVTAMRFKQTRVRIKTFKFGYGLIYKNNSVISSKLQSYVSPICENVPQIDFSVQLNNRNKYFDIDNPNSAINFLEVGQEVEITYGYEVSEGNVEWVKGQHLLCRSWQTDDTTATIVAQDVLRLQDTEYYLGQYYKDGISYYDLAIKVMEFGGIEDYYVDSRLQKLYTNNPLPRVSVKEALQIIANATRCILSQDRTGKVIMQSSFFPDVTVSSTNQIEYSQVENILNTDDIKGEYAELGVDYTTVNGADMYFIPRGEAVDGKIINTGYISNSVSTAKGLFVGKKPSIKVKLESSFNYYSLSLKFGSSLPSGINFITYKDSEVVNEYSLDSSKDTINTNLYVVNDFGDFDEMVIEFTGTQKPYNRITVDSFALGNVSDFKFEKNDMMSSPKAIKNELVKEVVVPMYTYSKSTGELEQLTQGAVTVTKNENQMFFFSEASYGYSAQISTGEGESEVVVSNGVTILDSSSYYVALKFNASGTYNLTINGYRYKITERNVINVLGERGSTVKWKNPLVSNLEVGSDLVEWLGDYYNAPTEYEYQTRGNPELDANDIVYQENEFDPNMKIKVYDYTLNFSQAFSGAVKARKVVDE